MILPRTESPPVAGSKDGDYYDRCPNDGCMEVDRSFKSGGTTMKRQEEYLDWSIFNADARQGGCGTTWSRTTSQGLARNTKRGQQTKYLTGTAARGRAYSLPTEQFRERFDAIDWSK